MAKGCSGLLVLGLFISLFIVNVRLRRPLPNCTTAKFDDVATGLHRRKNHIKFGNYLRFRATIKQNEPL